MLTNAASLLPPCLANIVRMARASRHVNNPHELTVNKIINLKPLASCGADELSGSFNKIKERAIATFK